MSNKRGRKNGFKLIKKEGISYGRPKKNVSDEEIKRKNKDRSISAYYKNKMGQLGDNNIDKLKHKIDMIKSLILTNLIDNDELLIKFLDKNKIDGLQLINSIISIQS